MDENFTELRGEIAGPPDTPYEGILTHNLTKYLPQDFIVVCHASMIMLLFFLFPSKVADISLK